MKARLKRVLDKLHQENQKEHSEREKMPDNIANSKVSFGKSLGYEDAISFIKSEFNEIL